MQQQLDATRPTPLARLSLGYMIKGSALALTAYLLTRAPLLFSVNPLALALLCAADGFLPWIGAGLALGLWQYSPHPWFYVASAILALCLRLLFCLFLSPSRSSDLSPTGRSHTLMGQSRQINVRQLLRLGQNGEGEGEVGALLSSFFDEPIRFRVIAAALAALIPGLGIPAASGFAYYDLYGGLFYLLLAPVCVCPIAYLLSDRQQEGEQGNTLLRALGGGILLFGVCFCARDISFLTLRPVISLTVLLALAAVDLYGLGVGLGIGLVGGLALDVRTVPLYLIAVFLYARLRPLFGGLKGAKVLALLPVLPLALLYTVLLGGTQLFWATVPSLAVGMLLLGAWEKLRGAAQAGGQIKTGAVNYKQDPDACLLLCEQDRSRSVDTQLGALAGAFGSLSEVFRRLGQTLSHPGAAEARRLCDEVYDNYCPDCPHRDTCWLHDYATTAEAIGSLSRTMAGGRNVGQDCLPPALRGRCPHTDTVLGEINYRLSRRVLQGEAAAENEVFAGFYENLSHLFGDLVHERGAGSDRDLRPSPPLSEAVARYLGEHDMHPTLVSVSGERRLTVRLIGLSPAALTETPDEVCAGIGRACGAHFSHMRYDGSDAGCLTLRSLPRLHADYVHRSLSAGETQEAGGAKRPPCGDTVRLFEDEQGMFYALVCDGMGAGTDAALTSGLCAMFLERVLRAGMSVSTALHMLNHYLLCRSTRPEDESCCTVDLLALDLYTGNCRFVKSGAAPTLILRGGRLWRLASHTVPIGILPAIDAQVIPFEVRPGDHILLMSDGLCETVSEGGVEGKDWLTEYLCGEECSEADGSSVDDSALIEALMAKAREYGSDDDLSVISVRIGEAE